MGYAPTGSITATTKVITIKVGGTEFASLTTEQLLTQKGLVVDAPLVGQIAIGEDPRAIAVPPPQLTPIPRRNWRPMAPRPVRPSTWSV